MKIPPLTAVVLAGIVSLSADEHAEGNAFPPDAGLFVLTDFGAIPDDNIDDTHAFDSVLANWEYCGGRPVNFKTIFIPDGLYLVSREVFWMRWLRMCGESETGTIIRLKDACPGFQDAANPRPVMRCRFTGNECSPWDGNNNSSFDNHLDNLTISSGQGNPGAIGLMYNNHNGGILHHVTIRSEDGAGVIGLDLSEVEFGPGLIHDVTINGFDTGIKTYEGPSHATLENITLINQGVVGFENHMPVSIRNLTSINTVPVIRNGPNWIAHTVLIGGIFSGAPTEAAAIENTASVYLRDIQAPTYRAVINDNGIEQPGSELDSYLSGDTVALASLPSYEHLNLPIADVPRAKDDPVSNWVTPADSAHDDTPAIQSALNSGAKTVYFRFGVKYEITSTCTIPASVERIEGMFATLHGKPELFGKEIPLFRIEGAGESPLILDRFNPHFKWGSRAVGIEVATSRDVVIRSSRGQYGWIRNAPGATGKLFLVDTHRALKLTVQQDVFIRHYNPENNPFVPHKSVVRTYLHNRGGAVWILGLKTEAPAIHCLTTNGGKTEVLGGFFRDHFPDLAVDARHYPYFVTSDGQTSASYAVYDSICMGYDTVYDKASRRQHALEIQGTRTAVLELPPGDKVVSLYRSLPGTSGFPPQPPSNLTMSVMPDGKRRLEWADNSDNEQGFRIMRSVDNGAFVEIARVDAGATTFVDGPPAATGEVSYRVAAYNAVGSSAEAPVEPDFAVAGALLSSPHPAGVPRVRLTTGDAIPHLSVRAPERETVDIRLFSPRGKLRGRFRCGGSSTIQLFSRPPARGLYVLEVLYPDGRGARLPLVIAR